MSKNYDENWWDWKDQVEMDNSTTYCINCDKKVKYEVLEYLKQGSIRGVNFYYTEKAARCVECGERIYVPKINDENCDAREEAFYKAKRNQ